MQFREKGKKILCIRTEYRAEAKRTFPVTVVTFDKYLSTAPEEVCRQLEKEEVEQLKKWLADRKEKSTVDSKKMYLSHVAYSMTQAAAALEDDSLSGGLSELGVESIFKGLEALKKAMKKAGFKQAEKTKSASVDSKTGSLPFGDE